MQREFTVPLYLKIFYYLLGLAIFAAGSFLFTLPNNGNKALSFFPIFFIFMGVIIVLNAVFRKVIVENGIITVKEFFRSQQIAVDDVKGIRSGRKVIYIVSNNPENAAIAIRNYNNLGNSGELLNYLKGTFSDLDAVEHDDEQKQLLEDTNLGFTTEERQGKLDNAKKIALVYNVLGVAVAIAGVALKQPIFVMLMLIYPLLSIAVILTSNGLIRFLSDGRKSIYPSVIIGFAASSVALFAKSMALYHFYSFDNFWLPFIGIGLIVGSILFKIGFNRSLTGSLAAQGALMLGVSLFYAFGCVGQINCAFDSSPDHVYEAAVIGHHISHGKSTSYYLYLSTWGPCHEQKQIDVGSKMYYNTPVGDSVKVDLKAGLLNIPWFVIKK